MDRRVPATLLLCLLLVTLQAQASSTYRCNSRLVSLEATTAEVRSKCGEPSNAALVGYKEIVDDHGYQQEVPVEEWVYGPNNGMLHFLRFEGNRLRQITSERGN
ncbi:MULTISPECIES: DUF2845 domain-containing protein [Stutzerimonas stutzeri subgroup]|jgi:hypothetical protein|uniref:DUF2845 domain-containing protein n=2 Tax=Stutzerimonas stutzeri subgroup TaxID=578833 RepID=A0A0D7E508_STUST|nr:MULTISPECIES: DUF2845 domain-containing protein [Stutzerimonas stutzeri subgroup]OCX96576.1 MAG: hypothetical protein BCV62_11925 [Pseudomonas sp. K35]CEG55339.1 conserved exported hypothetical protein [Stutzerimonas xanthomarina]HCG39625.1 DUF2845 domain-containing protein [Pseudomonas sp.]KIZ34667.1 hypothetical protein LO50_16485 [Stutzerimonas stutzeri]MCD1610230.1 DUF2845 domain-containing protein [Stutzerimonas kunmingensis]